MNYDIQAGLAGHNVVNLHLKRTNDAIQ